MKINRNNYEAFFIDYLEGNLDVKLVDHFIEFLQQNPDLKEELSLFETVSVEPEEITFSKKEILFKEKYDAEQEFNQAAIATLEGEISASDKADFELYLFTHPEKQKEATLFNQTKLQPDESIVFDKKNKLYHKSGGKSILLWTARVAAVLIMALSVYIFIDKSSTESLKENQLATAENTPEKKENTPVIKEPVKKKGKEEQKLIKQEEIEPAVKKTETQSEPNKTLLENLKGRLENDDFASIRINEEIPAELESLTPSVYAALPETELVPVKMSTHKTYETIHEEKFFVDVIKEKIGIEKLSLSKITKAGLSLVANLSKDKFKYETNKEGKVTELKYDSRILAFSFPTKNE